MEHQRKDDKAKKAALKKRGLRVFRDEWLRKIKRAEGQNLPRYLDFAPWRVPGSSGLENWTKINDVMVNSWMTQSKIEPSLGVFDALITNSCFWVNGLIKYFLETAGLVQDIKFINGTLMSYAIDGFNKRVPVPHCWLEIKDSILLDSTFVACMTQKEMEKDRIVSQYLKGNPLLAVAGNTTLHKFFVLYSKTNESIEMYVVFMLGTWFQFRIFDSLMREFIKKELGIEIPDLAKKWKKRCWNCLKENVEVKMCSGCKAARYCSEVCQKSDWKIRHKVLHDEHDPADKLRMMQPLDLTDSGSLLDIDFSILE